VQQRPDRGVEGGGGDGGDEATPALEVVVDEGRFLGV